MRAGFCREHQTTAQGLSAAAGASAGRSREFLALPSFCSDKKHKKKNSGAMVALAVAISPAERGAARSSIAPLLR